MLFLFTKTNLLRSIERLNQITNVVKPTVSLMFTIGFENEGSLIFSETYLNNATFLMNFTFRQAEVDKALKFVFMFISVTVEFVMSQIAITNLSKSISTCQVFKRDVVFCSRYPTLAIFLRFLG